MTGLFIVLAATFVLPKENGRLTGFAFGNGHYVKEPGAFSLIGNGHNNATSYDGFEFANGKAYVVGSEAPIVRVWHDPKTGEVGLENDEEKPFRVVEGKDVFFAAFEYRRRYPRTAAPGVAAKAGKFCVDIWNGTYREQAEFVRRAATELGVSNDVFLCTHVWQRYGYDNHLPDVYPPDPAFGTVEDMKALAATCRRYGWGFGVHHNVVDFYTNSNVFAWKDIARQKDGKPMYAWRNVFRGVQSYRMMPEVAPDYMKRSLDEMNADGFSPDMMFVDVIGSGPALPYWRPDGAYVQPAAARRHIGEVFDTIRRVQTAACGRPAFTASEAAHDYLIGHLDGGDCQWMEVTRENGEYCWNVIPEHADAEKVPWFDAVNHAWFSLHGAGYSIRYEAGRGELEHGIDSDDYLSAEVLSGHALMTDCYSRDVKDVLSGTVRPLDMDRCLEQLRRKWSVAQPVARELATAEMTGHEFVGGDIHRQRIDWSSGMIVYVNRGEGDWRVAGTTLPRYGWVALNPRTGLRCEVSREHPRRRVLPTRYLDVTPEEIVRNPGRYELHFWLAKRKPTENSRDYYDRLLKTPDEVPADAPRGVPLDRLVTVTDRGADPYDASLRYYLNGTPSFFRRFYLKEREVLRETLDMSKLKAEFTTDWDGVTSRRCGEPTTARIRLLLDGRPQAIKGIRLRVDDWVKPVGTETVDVPAEGYAFAPSTLKTPGFLRFTAFVGKKDFMRSVPYEPERLVKGSPTPADFMDYWRGEIARLEADGRDEPTMVPVTTYGKAFDAWRVSFATVGGRRVYGVLTVPKERGKEPLPVRFEMPSAGQPTPTYPASWIYSHHPEPNAVSMTIFAHCAEIDVKEVRDAYFERIRREHKEKYGVGYYPDAGISDGREAYHFHPVFLGAVRAVKWLHRQPYVDRSRFTYQGASQGGYFGLVLAGLTTCFTKVVVLVPAGTDTMGYLAGRCSGWPRLIETQRKENRAAAEKWAPYFDAANFAPYVTAPIRVLCGCIDTTCPPTCVASAFNALGSKDKAIVFMPAHGHGSDAKCVEALRDWRREGTTDGAGFYENDRVTAKVTGVAFSCGANTDPSYVQPDLYATFRKADGTEKEYWFHGVSHKSSFVVDLLLTPEMRRELGAGAAFTGLRMKGGKPETNAKIKVEDAKAFKEDLKPLAIQVTPRERLPFPNRKETIVPQTADPAEGDLKAEWNVKLPEGCKVERRRVGKSLVIDVAAPAGTVTEVPLGTACEAKKVKSFLVPYLTWGERKGRVLADLLEGGWFRLAEFDWYVSNASDVYARETPNGRELVARYRPDTAGKLKAVRERIVITLSKDFDEILPEIPNPKSPWKSVCGSHVWRSHPAWNRAEDAALWRAAKAAGFRHLAITDHETMWRDNGEPFTFCTVAAAGKGGDAAQLAYTKMMIDELGYRYGPYNNFTDLSTQSDFFCRDAVARRPDGSFYRAWMRCYGPKPVLMPAACDRFAGELRRKFGFNTAYCDVHTSMLPWQRTDYDARVPGAATYAQTYYSWGETLLKQKEHWNGPVYSEGAHQFMWAGLADGSYAQDRSYDFRIEPWLVDFELLRTQKLATDFGMGSLGMFSPPKTDLERMYYQPGVPKGRDELIDRFLAATVAFGHSGFLVCDGCWDPANAFGPAYGRPTKPVWRERGFPAEMYRSYFMIQALAAKYTVSEAESIRYAGADGRLRTASEALTDGSIALNRIVTRYRNGVVTVVNGNDAETWETTVDGRKLSLAPNGFAGWGEGVEVLSTDVDGRRVHTAEGPEYRYREVEGEKPEVTLK